MFPVALIFRKEDLPDPFRTTIKARTIFLTDSSFWNSHRIRTSFSFFNCHFE